MLKLIKNFLFMIMVTFSVNAFATDYETTTLPDNHGFHYERDYQDYGCSLVDGQVEYVLPERSRIDCLTSEDAIEYDFVKKHYECYTQALYYAAMTGLKPVCMIIIKEENTQSSVDKVKYKFQQINEHFGLDVELQFITE